MPANRTLHPAVAAVACAVPPHRLDQDGAFELLRGIWADQPEALRRLAALRRAIRVEERHLALPPEAYRALGPLPERIDAWRRASVELGERAIRDVLTRLDLRPTEIDHVFFVSTTGFSTPTADVTLAQRLGLRADVKRTPLFGLGCGAGAAALARAADYLRAYPDETALVLSVELCSLTFQASDVSTANVIGAALFGDGGAAVVLVGAARAPRGAARVVAGGSRLHADTERMAGWDVIETGFRLILAPELPAFWRQHIRPDVDGFLAPHGLERSRIDHWVVHTGGPKILAAFEEALELPRAAIERSWRALRRTGNLSSASVLFALADLLDGGAARAGEHALVLAMGPGLSSEAVLLTFA